MKVVLDTNVLIRIVRPDSANYVVWRKLFLQEYTMCYTSEILLEYEEILSEHYSKDVANAVVNFILSLPNAERITTYFRMRLLGGDADDNKFSDCAFAANAHYIISDDKHFNELKSIDFPKIEVLKLKEFREILDVQ